MYTEKDVHLLVHTIRGIHRDTSQVENKANKCRFNHRLNDSKYAMTRRSAGKKEKKKTQRVQLGIDGEV